MCCRSLGRSNMIPPPEPIFDLVRQAIDLAIKCVDTGETLVPFFMTEGEPGAVISIVADSSDQSLAVAQKTVNDFDARTKAFAFAYDGFITMHGERTDAIYVEASYTGSHHIYVFVQRYSPAQAGEPAARIGNWAYLRSNESRLKP